ncbi:MAG: hypothetical protein FJY76_02345 [Candidatus Aenigmarchaeota archaeon]|nr:hypothetical protein [Candidatus Aenigmarchaeota archaeon]
MTPAETAARKWIQLPGGVLVSNGYMRRGSRIFTPYDAACMDTDAFNEEAARYDVEPINGRTPPIDRLIRYSVVLRRRYRDDMRVPTFAGATDILVGLAKSRAEGDRQAKSLYRRLINGPLIATREVLKFRGRRPGGKYDATILRFDDEGALQPAKDIVVAGEGWMRELGSHGYPVETSEEFGCIAGIDDRLREQDRSGYWLMGEAPRKGGQRIPLRGPFWYGPGLLDARVHRGRSYSYELVGALRSRGAA